MATVRDAQFFNTLFKAADYFYKDKARVSTTITLNGKSYYIYKKPALKLFRFLMPQFRTEAFKDDDNLVKYIHNRRKTDHSLSRLTIPSTEAILPDKAHDDLDKLGNKEAVEQEKGFNEWMEKHLGEKQEKEETHGGGGGTRKEVKEEVVRGDGERGAPSSTRSETRTLDGAVSQQDPELIETTQPIWTAPLNEPVYNEPERREENNSGPQISRGDIERFTKSPKLPSVPEPIKDLSSRGQIAANRGVQATEKGLGRAVGGAVNDLLGQGGSKVATGLARQTALAGGRAAGAAIAGTVGWPVIIAILIAIALLFLLPIFNDLFLKPGALLPPDGIAYSAPLPPGSGGGSGSINSCKFYRGDPNTSGVQYKSTRIQSYFQEASSISGIPTALIAAIARVESGNVVNLSDSEIDNLSTLAKCPRSPTGALGIMQIQPPGTTGHFSPGVEQGAKFLNTTLGKLTESDFCDVRKSIILSTGFILKKLELVYHIGNGQKWDPTWTTNQDIINKVASSYYGCLLYGGSSDCTGPYNYGNDIWKSLNECRPVITPSPSAGPIYNPGGGIGVFSCPVNGGSVNYGSKEVGGHCSPNYGFVCVQPGQPGYTGRDTAVDVIGSSRTVFLPNLGGKSAEWTIDESGTSINDSEGGGIAVSANASYNGHTYRIRTVHINSTTLRVNQKVNSGTIIGTYNTNANHVHVTLQEDGVYKPADLYFNLCK